VQSIKFVSLIEKRRLIEKQLELRIPVSFPLKFLFATHSALLYNLFLLGMLVLRCA
jgi:hypothetical protein